MNRFFVWGGMMLLASAFPAVAVEKKYIDKKVRSESVEYSIGLAAQRGGLGHAFVIWNKGDDAARLTIQQAVGFYPTGDTKKYEAVFGSKPGKIFDDASEKLDYVLYVSVNSDSYERARQVYDKWLSRGNYQLGFNDCTTFASEIGAALNLKMPNRLFAPYPIDYIKAVASAN